MSQYHSLANEILKHIGGEDNIQSVGHCLTRLRFVLKDSSEADTDFFAEHPDIFNVIQAAGQYQLVIGHHVPDVYDTLISMTRMAEQQGPSIVDNSLPLHERFITLMTAIYCPFLGTMLAAGLIKTCAFLLGLLGLGTDNSALHLLLEVAGDGLFTLLPLFIAYTCSRYVRLNPSLGIAIACALLYPTPDIAQELTRLTGLPYVNYQQTILPILVAILVAAPLERRLKGLLPEHFRASLVPFFTLLIVVPLTLVVVGPLISYLNHWLLTLLLSTYRLSPILFGIVLGSSWQVLAILGYHWTLLAMLLGLGLPRLASIALMTATLVACTQLGVLLTLSRNSKDSRESHLFLTATVAALNGQLEPGLYGILLARYDHLWQIGLIGGLQGALLGFIWLSLTPQHIGLFSLIGGRGEELPYLLLVAVLGLFLAKILSEANLSSQKRAKSFKGRPTYCFEPSPGVVEVLSSPLTGEVILLKDMEDPVFASGAMGQGLAFEPLIGELYAPSSGYVLSIFPSRHAVRLVSDKGGEVLLHIGIDTVNLSGRGFVSHIKEGDRVEKGDLLLSFDLDLLAKEGFQATSVLLVTNTQDYSHLNMAPLSKVQPLDQIIQLIEGD